MARKLKAKPRSPEQIQAERQAQRERDFGAIGLAMGAANLTANASVEINRESQKQALTARRLDAFDALKAGMPDGAYDAARRLERDFRVRLGEDQCATAAIRVDNGRERDRMDRMLAAADRINAVLNVMARRDRWLLSELIAPSVPRDDWRDAVRWITGETHSHAQGAAVRAVCVNLRDAYQSLERAAA